MKDHETILKMIEEVDQNDSEKLDEIDARVWSYSNFYEFDAIESGSRCFWVIPKNTDSDWKGYCSATKKYTRSRDALKSIRPEGWAVRSSYHYPKPDCEYGFVMTNNPENPLDQYQIVGCSYRTEELAELHAIIQAIAYERSKS